MHRWKCYKLVTSALTVLFNDRALPRREKRGKYICTVFVADHSRDFPPPSPFLLDNNDFPSIEWTLGA